MFRKKCKLATCAKLQPLPQAIAFERARSVSDWKRGAKHLLRVNLHNERDDWDLRGSGEAC